MFPHLQSDVPSVPRNWTSSGGHDAFVVNQLSESPRFRPMGTALVSGCWTEATEIALSWVVTLRIKHHYHVVLSTPVSFLMTNIFSSRNMYIHTSLSGSPSFIPSHMPQNTFHPASRTLFVSQTPTSKPWANPMGFTTKHLLNLSMCSLCPQLHPARFPH